MHSKLRLTMAIGASFVLCLITALSASPAVAGVNRWTAIGPDGANVVALAVDPRTPSTVFAGTVSSGVLKSTDGGATWATANGALPTVYVSTVAINPKATSTLYAGTDVGVFKSTDGGQRWVGANAGLAGAAQIAINALAIDPGSPSTLYAATSGGLFKTVDGAANWTPINAGMLGLTPRVIAIDPLSPPTIYVGADDYKYGASGGVFKSIDAGASWKRVYTLPFAEDYQYSAAVIAIDPVLPSRLYLALDYGGAMKSADGGTSWSDISPIAELRSLAIDPAFPTTLYAGTYSGAVFQSSDAGDHWTLVKARAESESVNVLAITTSAPATVYAGGSTGILRSSDNAQTWVRLGLGVRNLSVYPLAVDPTDSSTIYTATRSGYVTKSTDGGVRWSDFVLGVASQPVAAFAIDPAAPATLYAAMGWSNGAPGSAAYKSLDGGVQWTPASNGLPTTFTSALAIAPSRTSTLYAGSIPGGVSKSVDGGSSWTRTNNGINGVALNVSALAIDPTNADIVYVATPPTGRPNIDARVFKSTDGAAQWRQVPIALPPGTSVTSLAVDPAIPSTVYATYGDYGEPGVGGVFTSNDGGETWIAPQNPLSTVWSLALAIDADSHPQIYAATRNGIFRSSDSAMSWTPLNSGLSNLDITSLAVDRTGSLLRAATRAGLFEYRVSGPQSPGTVALIEYVHAIFGDYFITSIPFEISKLDSGAVAGWTRTGYQFNAYAAANANSASVCRFFGTGFAPKSTHFYTPFATECSTLRTNPKWLLETTTAFAIAVPGIGGSCAAGLTPVYRFYNSFRGGAPNHRYTTDLIAREQMIAQGWVPEGLGPNSVQMCSPP